MAEPFLGEIMMVGFTFAPQGWALCNGQLMPISQNTALFSLLGTTYGGDGTTTFGLPNLQGRMPVHPNGSSFVLGQTGGVAAVTLALANMPSHTHAVNCNGSAAATGASSFAHGIGQTPVGNYPALAASPGQAVYAASSNAIMSAGMIGPAGSGTPVSTISPYLVVNFVIALEGIFPSRN